MTPRKPFRTDLITWESIELAIQTYDRDYIQPRQEQRHAENVTRLVSIESRTADIEQNQHDAERDRKLIKNLLKYCAGVLTVLLTDYLWWAIATKLRYGGK